ncbi:hypothetical protein P4S72_01660 [Vibrio sp. PP-XX7]
MALDELARNILKEGIISGEEANILIQAEYERLYVINVDDFASKTLMAQKITVIHKTPGAFSPSK